MSVQPFRIQQLVDANLSQKSPASAARDEFKAKVLAACNESGVSISAVALAHGLNAKLVRNWHQGRGLKRAGIGQSLGAPTVAAQKVT